jgi:hypothetical protein
LFDSINNLAREIGISKYVAAHAKKVAKNIVPLKCSQNSDCRMVAGTIVEVLRHP